MNKIAIFASGSGTNASRLISYFKSHKNISVELVVCNNDKALVLNKASESGVDTLLISKSELQTSEKILSILISKEINFIVLAGFLLKVPEWLIENYTNKIINIHPSLLPKYGGKGMYGHNVHKSVLENSESESGITIHYVNKEYDKGQIIYQAKCRVDKEDTIETLSEKIHKLEYESLPKVVEELLTK